MDFSNIPEGSSNPDSDKKPADELVFYYSREERLKHAPQSVRDFYEGKYNENRPGLFKALVATRANRMIFFVLIICAALVFINAYLGPKANSATLFGIPLELKAFSVEDKIYVSLKCGKVDRKSREKLPASVFISAEVSGIDSDETQILTETIEDVYDGSERFMRIAFSDFDIVSVAAKISVKNEDEIKTASVKTKVERR